MKSGLDTCINMSDIQECTINLTHAIAQCKVREDYASTCSYSCYYSCIASLATCLCMKTLLQSYNTHTYTCTRTGVHFSVIVLVVMKKHSITTIELQSAYEYLNSYSSTFFCTHTVLLLMKKYSILE